MEVINVVKLSHNNAYSTMGIASDKLKHNEYLKQSKSTSSFEISKMPNYLPEKVTPAKSTLKSSKSKKELIELQSYLTKTSNKSSNPKGMQVKPTPMITSLEKDPATPVKVESSRKSFQLSTSSKRKSELTPITNRGSSTNKKSNLKTNFRTEDEGFSLRLGEKAPLRNTAP